MAKIIQEIFVNPPLAIARLGGSTSPQDAYKWVAAPNPHSRGETAIAPDWSLTVQPGGTVIPKLPSRLEFRDGELIRPVCPFFELWAMMGEPNSAQSTWREVPITPALLTQQGTTLTDLVVRVNAQNSKAMRRTNNAEVRFGTFPPVEIRGDNNVKVQLLATSPSTVPASRRMIPPTRSIPLGFFQIIKSSIQPAPGSIAWSKLVDGRPLVNIEVIRFRFTPARGLFYGPPQAAQPQTAPDGGIFVPIESTRAFLNPNNAWVGFDAQANGIDAPTDTYDGADVANTDNGPNPSLGIIDDTCEARIEVILKLSVPSRRTLTASANVFVGPPDFAPDRRPFLSLADELNDRMGDGATRTKAMSAPDRDAWVQDLFERIYETVSLLNVDRQRSTRAATLRGSKLAPAPIPNDGTPSPTRAMGGRDALRNRLFSLPTPNQNVRLPLSEHARMRHRALADLQSLRDFVSQNPGRLTSLIRRAFEVERGEDSETSTMRMPPFMRNSNAQPLTLSAWQYDLLMAWVKENESPARPLILPRGAARHPPSPPMSEAATRRRTAVLTRVRRREET